MTRQEWNAAPDPPCSSPPARDAAGRLTLAGHQGFSLIEMLLVVAVVGIVAAMAVPMTDSALNGQRFRADAQAVTNLVSLAKMRASAGFTRARVRAQLNTGTFALERWNKATARWVVEGGRTRTSRGVTFGFADLGEPPPNTQAAIGQSPACLDGIEADADVIADTACIAFNSRGLPVDGGGVIFGGHGLYLTNGSTVYAITVTATPRIRRWWTGVSAANWEEQQ